MRRSLLRLWKASQPYLRLPRLWVAYALRAVQWRTTYIAITGSNGKTTAARVLACILAREAPTKATRINRNTMPGITEIIAFCNPFRTRFAVLEVGAGNRHAIRNAVRLIRPRIAVVLCVNLEHRSFFKTVEAVAVEKAALPAGLARGGLAVLNGDDPLVAGMAVPEGCRRIRFGSAPGCEVSFENLHSAWPDLLRFTAVVGGRRQEIRSRLLGSHWVGPLLAAIATADALGVPLGRIADGIADAAPYPGRMQVVRLPGGAVVIRDEFKASPHTIDVAFEEAEKAQAQRKFLVFGDVSETSHSPRVRLKRIGRRAARIFDYTVFIGDKAMHGVAGACGAGLPADHAQAFAGYAEAADYLRPLLGPGDLVLLKASRDNQLTRTFYSLIGDVRCTVASCDRPLVCDDCPRFGNPELVRHVNRQLTVNLR